MEINQIQIDFVKGFLIASPYEKMFRVLETKVQKIIYKNRINQETFDVINDLREKLATEKGFKFARASMNVEVS